MLQWDLAGPCCWSLRRHRDCWGAQGAVLAAVLHNFGTFAGMANAGRLLLFDEISYPQLPKPGLSRKAPAPGVLAEAMSWVAPQDCLGVQRLAQARRCSP